MQKRVFSSNTKQAMLMVSYKVSRQYIVFVYFVLSPCLKPRKNENSSSHRTLALLQCINETDHSTARLMHWLYIDKPIQKIQ